MLSQKPNVVVVPKLTTEERFKMILARPRNRYARVRLAIPQYKPLKKDPV